MPQHKRGPWSQAEDQYLLHLVSLHSAHNWVRISATMQTRSPKQCRERFHQNLKPNLNHDPISPEEGVLIEQMVAEMGKRWAEIARRLRGRSDNAVKNWWNGSMNRRRRSTHPRRIHVGDASHGPRPSFSLPRHHQPLASGIAQQSPSQYYGQPLPQTLSFPHPISVPSNAGAMYGRPSGMIETPLPSPSAYSQFSTEGAPSLISDNSSMSGRSPHNGHSPIELPPLAGARDDCRPSTGPAHRFSASGYPTTLDADFSTSLHLKPEQQPTLQAAFMPQQSMQRFPPPPHYLPSQQQQLQSHPIMRSNSYASTASALQLPSISNLAASPSGGAQNTSCYHMDPVLGDAHAFPTPDHSPKDKMRLSNLTH